jgi:hypothetical protein
MKIKEATVTFAGILFVGIIGGRWLELLYSHVKKENVSERGILLSRILGL